MTYWTGSLERFVNNLRTSLKTWPRLLSFRQPKPAESPSRDFAVPVFVSVVIHVFLAHLLWIAFSGPTAIEPAAPTTDTHLIVSLSTFTAASHEGMDLEVIPAVPRTDPPAQRSRSSPEHSRSAERKPEAETVETLIIQEVPGSETPGDKSLAAVPTPSFDLEVLHRMARDFKMMPELKVEAIETTIDREVPGSETPGDKSLAACLNTPFSLETYLRIDREFLRMSDFEIQDFRFKLRMRYMNKYKTEVIALRRDCRNAYSGAGLLAIPLLIRDAITGKGCKWYPKAK